MDIRRGDIFYIENRNAVGSEQDKTRPALVVSNDTGNACAPVVMVVWLTTQEKAPLPTHCTVRAKVASTALCENINTISKDRVLDYIRTATEQEMAEVDKCLSVALGIVQVLAVEDTGIQHVDQLISDIDRLFYREADEKVAQGIDKANSIARQMYRRLVVQ